MTEPTKPCLICGEPESLDHNMRLRFPAHVYQPTTTVYLDQADIGRLIGRPAVYVRAHVRRAGKLPTPDVMVGTNPGWAPATIDRHLAEHPELLTDTATWTQP